MKTARIVLVLAGLAAAAFGVVGLLTADHGPRPLPYVEFALAGLLGHDLVLAPVALTLGALAGKLLPTRHRALLRAALLVTTLVTLVAFPFALGAGYSPTNPSALPLNYRHGLLIALAAIWLATTALLATRALRIRRQRPKDVSGGPHG